MSQKFEHNFLKNVTARIDFAQNYYAVSSDAPSPFQQKVKPLFPFIQRKKAMAEQIQVVSETELKRRHVTENHWFFQAGGGEKTVCLAPNFMWVDYKKYTDFADLKESFEAAVDGLAESFPDLSATRFGLRYFNNIEFTDPHTTEWEGYLNPNLLSIFSMADDRKMISRAFHNLELNYGDMNLTFLYGMHNPDYPAPIKQKVFVLDFDAYIAKAQTVDQLKANLQVMHDRIAALFEKSITDKLREIMK